MLEYDNETGVQVPRGQIIYLSTVLSKDTVF